MYIDINVPPTISETITLYLDTGAYTTMVVILVAVDTFLLVLSTYKLFLFVREQNWIKLFSFPFK